MKSLSKGSVLIGFVILFIIAGAFYWFELRKPQLKVSNNPVQVQSIEQQVEDKFNVTIPDNVEKTELKDVSGGTGGGVATRTEILAYLPDLTSGKVYQASLENKDGKRILLGSLRIAKGGYLIEYTGSTYPGYDKVIITLDGKSILEGSF